jgi:protein-S-isoprenylcysteine O-methyltransferase Ste14
VGTVKTLIDPLSWNYPGMTIYNWLIVALWLVFITYWAISAISAKRSIGARAWWEEGGLRLSAVLLVLAAPHFAVLNHARQNVQAHVASSMIVGIIGVALCGLGIGLAILARGYLGRNWGMPMSRKENPELVTNGPYAFVRHPIYTGILLAMLGSAIDEIAFWVVPLMVFGAYFIYSARREEKLMIEQFPELYVAFTKRTRMFLPFVL